MKRLFLLTAFIFCQCLFAQEKVTLNYYLPQNISYDPSIPKPIDIVGHEVGEWHVTHDKLMFYMQTLASVSERIS
ncbi:MAG: hypothetical protein WBN39_10240, partial [Flavobacteriaceae bacterium]